MSEHDCPSCKCTVKEEDHKHFFNQEPSWIDKSDNKTTKVWICANKSGKYCHERKEEVTNA